MSIPKKILNTFLTPKFLWGIVIKDEDYNLNKKIDKTIVKRLLRRIFWFWPTLHHAFIWKEAKKDSGQGYENFIEITTDVQYLMDEVVKYTPNLNSSILDIGCNVGRGLNYLNNKGYTNLFGVDISDDAIKNSVNVFPRLETSAHIELNYIQKYLLSKDDRFFSTTYTKGATIELVPSSFPLIKEITRVTLDHVVLMISNSSHYYPRFWEYEFSRYSFHLIYKYMYSLDREEKADTVLLVFKRKK